MFERDDVSLRRLASFFHQEALKQQVEAEAMLGYLAERGGNYCGRDIQVKSARKEQIYTQSLLFIIIYFFKQIISLMSHR